jgi:hypothetical protein
MGAIAVSAGVVGGSSCVAAGGGLMGLSPYVAAPAGGLLARQATLNALYGCCCLSIRTRSDRVVGGGAERLISRDPMVEPVADGGRKSAFVRAAPARIRRRSAE